MNPSVWTCWIGLMLISSQAIAVESRQADAIRFSRDRTILFLNADDLARSLKFELKVVDPRRLVTFCRDKDGGYCIPIRLTAENHRRNGEQLLIAADVVSQALRFRFAETGGRITITAGTEPATGDTATTTPGYNARWKPGRGFGQGDTLPDIPLVDVSGSEVRFSQFLGQRYILYCWASW